MSYIGRDIRTGAFRQLDDISSGFDGSDTTHTMQVNSTNVSVGDVNQILLSLGGVIQKPGTDFTVSGSTLTFTTAPAANTSFFAVLLGSDNGGTVTPTDASVTVSKLAIAGGEVKLDADGDTSITADTDDRIDFKAGGTDTLHVGNGVVTVGTTTAFGPTGFPTGVKVNGDVLIGDFTNDVAASTLCFIKSRNTTPGSQTIVNNGDEVGSIDFRADDGDDTGYNNNVARIAVAIDAAPGTNDTAGNITFATTADGARTATEHMRLDSVGRLTLGGFADDSGSSGRIRTRSDANDNYIVYFTNSGNSSPYGGQIQFSAASPDNNASTFYNFRDSTTVRCTIYSDGDIKNHDGTFTSISSDERLKSNIVDANSQWDDIKAIKFRNFKKKDDIEQYGADNAKILLGVVAQEAESVTPKLVQNRDPYAEEIKLNSAFGTLYEDGDTLPEGKKIGDIKEVKEQVKTFKDSILFWKCAKALQEAMAKIETLEADVKTLKGE